MARTSSDSDLYLAVRVQPRASREGVDGRIGERVRIRVNAPPVNDAANQRVIELMARAFGVPRSQVDVVSGNTRRDKLLRIRGARKHPPWME